MSREAIYLAALDRIAEDYDAFDTPGYVPLQKIGSALRQRQRIAAEAIKVAAQEGSGVDGLRSDDAPTSIELIRRVSEALAKARGVKIVDEVDQRLFERDARAVMGIINEARNAERERAATIAEDTAKAAQSCERDAARGLKVYHQIYADIASGIAADIRNTEHTV
jgi:hypothetical protein